MPVVKYSCLLVIHWLNQSLSTVALLTWWAGWLFLVGGGWLSWALQDAHSSVCDSSGNQKYAQTLPKFPCGAKLHSINNQWSKYVLCLLLSCKNISKIWKLAHLNNLSFHTHCILCEGNVENFQWCCQPKYAASAICILSESEFGRTRVIWACLVSNHCGPHPLALKQ